MLPCWPRNIADLSAAPTSSPEHPPRCPNRRAAIQKSNNGFSPPSLLSAFRYVWSIILHALQSHAIRSRVNKLITVQLLRNVSNISQAGLEHEDVTKANALQERDRTFSEMGFRPDLGGNVFAFRQRRPREEKRWLRKLLYKPDGNGWFNFPQSARLDLR